MLPRRDYYAFERLEHRPSELAAAGPWDVLLSAYDESERVTTPFRDLPAHHKQWLIHEEYGFSTADWPAGAIELTASFDPADILDYVIGHRNLFLGSKVCIDSTGFVRPHLLVLLHTLLDIGVRSFDVIYSDPVRYVADENTEFAGTVTAVEQVLGYEGVHSATANKEIIVIGAGYDYEQISRACEARRSATKYILTGLPSLQPHMYQESVLRIERASESIGYLTSQRRLYAPANNPFAVAQVLHDLVSGEQSGPSGSGASDQNLYLCPVGPKPHVLGFALFYLREMQGKSASIIYPFAKDYRRMTTDGLLRTWQFRFEL